MFGKKSKAGPIDSLIGVGSRIEGNVSFSGGLRVDGQVQGNICSVDNKPSTLVLSELGQVEGEINVAHMVINGSVHGPIRATEYLELLPKARVSGDVYYHSIEIHVGAVVSGKLIHEGQKQDKVVELKPATGN